MNALIVDDSRTTRLILRTLLRQLGFDVAEAGGARAGLDHLKQFPETSLVLVDWNMPDVDGIAFIREVRAAGRSDIQLLMVSGEEGVGQAATAMAAGANGFISKPFTQETIARQLKLLEIGQG